MIELKAGRRAVADTHYHRVVFFSQTGELLGMFGERGEEPGQFIYPCHLTEDPQGNIYVAEYGGNDRVQKFTPEMEFILEFGEAGTGPGQLQRTGGIGWHEGSVYVCDIINNRVQKFSDEGKLLGALRFNDGIELEYPYDIAIGKDGRVDIIEYKSGRLSQVSLDGQLQGRYGQTGRKTGEFWTPWGIATTPDGRIVVADTGNRRIVELSL
jgi:DNA-binding beta-propeller fold protein YncE